MPRSAFLSGTITRGTEPLASPTSGATQEQWTSTERESAERNLRWMWGSLHIAAILCLLFFAPPSCGRWITRSVLLSQDRGRWHVVPEASTQTRQRMPTRRRVGKE